MDLMDRTSDRRRMHGRDRIEHKLDDAMRDNARLEQANHLLREELERDDREREHIWSAVETGMRGRRGSGWFRRTLVLGAGIGAAYVAGARAGRGRYDEIVSWWERMRGRAGTLQDDMQRSMRDTAGAFTDQLAGTIEHGASTASGTIERGASKASTTIEDGGRTAAKTVRSTPQGSSVPTPSSSSASKG